MGALEWLAPLPHRSLSASKRTIARHRPVSLTRTQGCRLASPESCTAFWAAHSLVAYERSLAISVPRLLCARPADQRWRRRGVAHSACA